MKNILPYKAKKRKPLPRPAIVTKIYDLGLVDTGPADQMSEIRFSLSKRNGRTNVTIHKGTGELREAWSLSLATGVYPKTYPEAREYVARVALSHGYDPFPEIKKKQPPRGANADYKLLKEGGCKEEWLNSDVPAMWGEAAFRCQHPGRHCTEDGFCHYRDCDMQMREG